jgi:hypothetical protein
MVRLFAITALACGLASPITAQSCTYSNDGTVLDLSGLTRSGSTSADGYYTVNSTQFEAFLFLFNICGPIDWQDYASPNVCPSGATGSCEVEIKGETQLVWENYGAASGYSISHQDGENGQPAGLVVTMNSTTCTRLQDGTIVQTKIYLLCDESAVTPVAEIIKDSYWGCYMHARLRTKLVCGIAPPPQPGPPPAPPHAGNEYRCVDNKCENTGPGSGVSNTTCAASCGPKPTKYICADSRCIPSEEGVPEEECQQICKPATTAPTWPRLEAFSWFL